MVGVMTQSCSNNSYVPHERAIRDGESGGVLPAMLPLYAASHLRMSEEILE